MRAVAPSATRAFCVSVISASSKPLATRIAIVLPLRRLFSLSILEAPGVVLDTLSPGPRHRRSKSASAATPLPAQARQAAKFRCRWPARGRGRRDHRYLLGETRKDTGWKIWRPRGRFNPAGVVNQPPIVAPPPPAGDAAH